MNIPMKSYVFGSGGFANEVLLLAEDCDTKIDAVVCLEYSKSPKVKEILETDFSPEGQFQAYVAVGSPIIRKKIVEKLLENFGNNVNFPKLIHPTSRIMGLKQNDFIGKGTLICANCTLTSDIKIGNFSQINLHCTIGHDTEVGDYFTAAPGVNISGSCSILDNVYFGTNSCTREKINIVSNVIVGCAAAVVGDIQESGTYAGIPARRIKHG